MSLFKAVVLPTLLHGSETWAPIAIHVQHLQGFIMKCVWVILGVTRWDEKRNTDSRAIAGLQKVEVMMMKRRLRWLRHVARMKENTHTHTHTHFLLFLCVFHRGTDHKPQQNLIPYSR